MRGIISAAFLAVLSAAGPAMASEHLPRSKRVLLVFAGADDPALKAQGEILEAIGRRELEERDMLVLQVPARGETQALFGRPAKAYPAEALRKRYSVASDGGFTVVLVGKDGGTKWRDVRPAREEDLLPLIDSMPMRMHEMRRNRPAD